MTSPATQKSTRRFRFLSASRMSDSQNVSDPIALEPPRNENGMESRQDMESRHRKERKQLQSTLTALKKQAQSGDKKKKKQIQEDMERMEKQVKERHEQEIRELQGQLNRVGPSIKHGCNIDVDGCERQSKTCSRQ